MTGIAPEYDVIVIGGGPAGSTAGTLVAREGGKRVLLLDRERFPRFRIGESLIPATYWTLRRLGMLERLGRSAFPRKHSVQFYTADGRSSRPFYFTHVDPHESSVTWQVDRATFDRMLLDNAAESGVDVVQEANVLDVLFEGTQAVGVVAEFRDGSRREIRCKVVVDASGQSGFLSRKLGLKVQDPKLLNTAVFARYRGVVRDPGIDGGATLVLRTKDSGSWFWFIPLPDDLLSIGAVGPATYMVHGRKGDPQQILDEELQKCPALLKRMTQATQVGEARMLRDFSYISRRIAGDGWVLCGDAFGFLDPIYSTGVLLAFKGAERAADAIIEGFRTNDFSGELLGRDGARFVEGMEALRKLVYAYYHPTFSIARFAKRKQEFRTLVTHMLMGNVFGRPLDGLFEALGEEIELPESRVLEEGVKS
jgi:flavin-dependent dehydrogenase